MITFDWKTLFKSWLKDLARPLVDAWEFESSLWKCEVEHLRAAKKLREKIGPERPV